MLKQKPQGKGLTFLPFQLVGLVGNQRSVWRVGRSRWISCNKLLLLLGLIPCSILHIQGDLRQTCAKVELVLVSQAGREVLTNSANMLLAPEGVTP